MESVGPIAYSTLVLLIGKVIIKHRSLEALVLLTGEAISSRCEMLLVESNVSECSGSDLVTLISTLSSQVPLSTSSLSLI